MTLRDPVMPKVSFQKAAPRSPFARKARRDLLPFRAEQQ
ncbi:hypothetical protein HMPREF7215_2109 [Pyramidobacter piscolens W5455]|uniref:Uncharacterized protein n=1 Tax=Pyramidobacter piscolens W5455 TaxID=352165 RepID=A0ABP2HT29_9BACT|nr:hypothetical protein HMPREF7215_2109 [Pyramidobacter piscolens W5455]